MPASHQNLRAGGIPAMLRVISAFTLREVTTRFGRNRLGLIWALAEPCIYILGFVLVRSYIGSGATPFGDNIIVFFLSGLLCLRMFLAVSSKGIGALRSNIALLTYPPVKPTDVIIGRLLLETLTMLIVFTIFFVGLILTTESKLIFHPQRLFAAIGVLTFLSLSVGVFNAVFSALTRIWERVWRLLRLPLFFCSGIFYLPKALPPLAQDILYFNPILHAVEWVRTGIYLSYEPLLDRSYVLSFSAVVLALGLFLERLNRTKIRAL